MDVNGTPFHLLTGRADWAPRLAEPGLAWDDGRRAVSLAPRLFRFPARRPGEALDAGGRRGAGRDAHGRWYWIGGDRRRIRFRTPGGGDAATWWTVDDLYGRPETAQGDGEFAPLLETGPRPLPVLSGLAVTEHGYLAAGTLEPAGLLVFDLPGGGPPAWQRWPAEVPFAPFDLAAAPGGGLWVLDRPAGGETPRLWLLDRYFRVLDAGGRVELAPTRREDFAPDGEEAPTRPARTFPAGLSLELSSPLEAVAAVAVAALPDGSALVLESDPALPYSVVHRYVPPGETGGDLAPAGDPVSLAGALDELVEGDGDVRGHDLAFVPGASAADGTLTGDLYVADSAGDQSFVFALAVAGGVLGLEPRPRYLPMRRFAGKALAAAPGGEVFYDLGESWIPLAEQPRVRYAPSGQAAGLLFDGKKPGCVWHRLTLDAQVPAGDRVEVSSRAADRAELLAQAPWQSEPRPVLRASGSELPFHRPFSAEERRAEGTGTWELLFQRAAGRFLELRLTLRGSGRSTPRVRALRVWYPRFSYLGEYLPAVYREDAGSAWFLDRYLANPEGIFTALEGRIAAAQTLFDLSAADSEYLGWLGGWLGAVLDPSWDDARRRLFLRHAEKLFRWRGTRGGLERAVRLAIDACPGDELFAGLEPGGAGPPELGDASAARIVEDHEGRELPDAGRAHRFTVMVPASAGESREVRDRRLDLARRVAEREKPAHTELRMELFWALLRVGEIRLGRTVPLGEGSRWTALALGAAHLGESYLPESHPWSASDRRVLGRDPLTET